MFYLTLSIYIDEAKNKQKEKDMKRTLIIVISVLMMLSMFAACTQQPAASTAPDASTAPAESAAPAESTEPAESTAPANGFPLEGMAVKDGKQLYLGNVCSENSSGWMSAYDGYAKGVWERAGGKYSSTVSNSNADLELTQFNDLAQLKPDVIFCHPTDSFAISPAVKAAREANIPVFAIDMAVTGTDVDCYIHLSQQDMGAADGQYIIDNFSAENPAVILEIGGSVKQNAAIERNEGFHSVIDKSPYCTVVNTIYCEWSNDKSMSAVQDALQRDPNINVIFVHSDCMLNGVIQALQGADRLKKVGEQGHIMICSIDCDPTGAKALEDGYVDVVQEHSPTLHIATAVNAALAMINGETVPKEILVKSVGRTAADVKDSWGAQNPDMMSTWDYNIMSDEFFPIPTK